MAQQRFIVSDRIPSPARTLLALLQHQLKLTKAQAFEVIHDGGVSVNGKHRTSSHFLLEPGDRVEVEWVPQPALAKSSRKKKPESTFSVVYDDPDLMVVIKPANLLTVPTPHRESKTLLSLLSQHIQRTGSGDQAYCVHRLDRGVSGLLVFAKHLAIAEAIRDQFAERKPERQYIAIAAGRWTKQEGTIRSYLATDADLNRYSTDQAEQGELAITHYRVREEWSDASLLEIHLETGRRNQIRVHLAEAQHPVLGDPRYRRHEAEHWAWPYRRLALHAESLAFHHPRSGQKLAFRSSWPEEFRAFRRAVERPANG